MSDGATTGYVSVDLSCHDPVESGFASGCSVIEYRIDGGPLETYREAVRVAAIGQHTFEYRSIDAAANEESFRSVSTW